MLRDPLCPDTPPAADSRSTTSRSDRAQSDFARNLVAVSFVGAEKVAPQHAPDDVFSCAMTFGLPDNGNPAGNSGSRVA